MAAASSAGRSATRVIGDSDAVRKQLGLDRGSRNRRRIVWALVLVALAALAIFVVVQVTAPAPALRWLTTPVTRLAAGVSTLWVGTEFDGLWTWDPQRRRGERLVEGSVHALAADGAAAWTWMDEGVRALHE